MSSPTFLLELGDRDKVHMGADESSGNNGSLKATGTDFVEIFTDCDPSSWSKNCFPVAVSDVP